MTDDNVIRNIYGLNSGKNSIFFNSKNNNKPKKTRKKIDKNIRNIVWRKYNKTGLVGKCYVCKREITYDNFDIGHNKAVAKGGSDNINNLRTICRSCNSAMGTKSIEAYRKKYFVNKPKGKIISNKTKRKEVKNWHYEKDIFGNKRKVRNDSGRNR